MKLSKLDKYEQFTIPSINRKGVVLEHGLGSSLVMYYDVKTENKMGDTEVVRHGKIDNKIQQRTEKS